MNDSVVDRKFLQHLILLIKENMDKLPAISKAANEFEAGKSQAYYEVADFIMECSRIFDAPLISLGITNFNPDVLL